MNQTSDLLKGKTCLVTGATSGIGEVTARELARQGAQVILVGRNRAKCEITASNIQADTSNPNITYLVADLSSQAQVRQLAKAFKENHPSLDVLVNNAGGFFLRRQLSVDAIEMTFALNHLAYFLLTNLLLEPLKAAAVNHGESRVVVVASASHKGTKLNFNDLQMARRYQPLRAYGCSKLANILFTYELARRLKGTQVTANALHPGLVGTNIAKNNGWLLRVVMPLVMRNSLSPQEGARTSIYLASSSDVRGISGKYFIKQRAVPSDPASYDEAAAQRLWAISEKLTGVTTS